MEQALEWLMMIFELLLAIIMGLLQWVGDHLIATIVIIAGVLFLRWLLGFARRQVDKGPDTALFDMGFGCLWLVVGVLVFFVLISLIPTLGGFVINTFDGVLGRAADVSNEVHFAPVQPYLDQQRYAPTSPPPPPPALFPPTPTPAPPVLPPPPPAGESPRPWGPCGTQYVVQPGDKLAKIAEMCRVDYNEMLSLNPGLQANPNLIYPGQVIILPPDP